MLTNLTASAAGASTPAAEADISSDRNEDSRKKLLPKSMILLKPLLQHQKSPLYRKPPLLRNRLLSPEPKGMIALTFDDGPSDFTDRLLDCLEANNVKLLFSWQVRKWNIFREPVKRMEELGCEIGNHSYDHPDLTTLSRR